MIGVCGPAEAVPDRLYDIYNYSRFLVCGCRKGDGRPIFSLWDSLNICLWSISSASINTSAYSIHSRSEIGVSNGGPSNGKSHDHKEQGANEEQSRSHVNTRNAWIFFAITVVEAVANCALEAVLFYLVASQENLTNNTNNQQALTIPTYLAIYILALYALL